jgi:SRF-type transcription factor (DNA-binding and dimerisation domain)
MAIDNLKGKRENSRLRKGENLRRRKETLFKKVYEVGKYNKVDVALILRQNGRYFTYRSINLKFWLPSIKEIVRLYYSFNITITC